MTHLVLLGDSIFDNAMYVPSSWSVIDQVQQHLTEAGDRATLLALDGSYINGIAHQLQKLPDDATHLFISTGGNDILGFGWKLYDETMSFPDVLEKILVMKRQFHQDYQTMLHQVLAHQKPVTLCTVYDQIPQSDALFTLFNQTLLPLFNDCITRQAIAFGLPLIDLRLVCDELGDYSSLSPIEPSVEGGGKIAQRVAMIAKEHDFSMPRTVCYS